MSPLPDEIVDALAFEASNWANGSVFDDPFYDAPLGTTDAVPGRLLKVEKDVETSKYLLPPATALSRIVYQSEDLNACQVPVSAFVLWPYSPKSQADGYPIVAWAHGTSGFSASGAPSNHKSLFQHFLAPHQLALQGYVVVGTDYAGFGVHKHSSGEPITHQYLACPSHANDVIYSVQAAQEAFPGLSKQFVVMAHSQGGGAAWAVAQRQVNRPVPGYLGAVAVSPMTKLLDQSEPLLSLIAAAMCPGLASAFPAFKPGNVLTEEGQQRLAFAQEYRAGLGSGIALLLGGDLLNANWTEDPYVQEYLYVVSNGGKEIAGPLLVIHGEIDDRLNASATSLAVDKTAELFPSSQLEYIILPQMGHVAALQASQRVWMDWIADRFAGREIRTCCQRRELTPARPTTSYQAEQNWYIKPATQFYHAP